LAEVTAPAMTACCWDVRS